MSVDMNKYKFFKTSGNKIIAVSSYAGRSVRGVASCDPRDSFNESKGQYLAAARCNAKIADKRVRRASRKVREAEEALKKAQRFYNDMTVYYADSIVAQNDAWNSVSDILNEM